MLVPEAAATKLLGTCDSSTVLCYLRTLAAPKGDCLWRLEFQNEFTLPPLDSDDFLAAFDRVSEGKHSFGFHARRYTADKPQELWGLMFCLTELPHINLFTTENIDPNILVPCYSQRGAELCDRMQIASPFSTFGRGIFLYMLEKMTLINKLRVRYSEIRGPRAVASPALDVAEKIIAVLPEVGEAKAFNARKDMLAYFKTLDKALKTALSDSEFRVLLDPLGVSPREWL